MGGFDHRAGTYSVFTAGEFLMANLFGEDDTPVPPKKAKKPPKCDDPRREPIIKFAYDSFREEFGVTMIITGRDGRALNDMLSRTGSLSEYDLEHLQQYWRLLLDSKDNYERNQVQGSPLAYFANNILRLACRAHAKN